MLPLRLKPQIPTSIIETLDMLENDVMCNSIYVEAHSKLNLSSIFESYFYLQIIRPK